MTAAPPPFLPPPRAIPGWWRDLTALQPRRLWFAVISFHRVEALVAVARTSTLDPLRLGLLRRLAAPESPPPDALPLDRPLLRRLMSELEADGLLAQGAPTEAGRRALTDGTFVTGVPERRSFSFVDNACCGRPAHFIHLNRPPSGSTSIPEGWHFDAALLVESVHRSPEWKARQQFPTEVLSVIGPSGAPASGPTWRRVMVDHAEQALLVLAEMRSEGSEPTLHGFTVRPEGWSLFREAPLLTLTGDWSEVFPELTTGPSAEEWRSAWLTWCESHGIPAAEMEGCQLEPSEDRLHVRVPKRILERLRAAKGDPLKHEACLLVGEVRARLLAALEAEAIAET